MYMHHTSSRHPRQVHAWESLLPRVITATHKALFAEWKRGQLVRTDALLTCERYARGSTLSGQDVLSVLVDLEAVTVDANWLVTVYTWVHHDGVPFASLSTAYELTVYRLNWLVHEAHKRKLWERFQLLRWADLIEQSHEVLP